MFQMDGENNERCNIDCPDDTNLDITFTQVLKGNEYDTRRVDELTAAEYDSNLDSEFLSSNTEC